MVDFFSNFEKIDKNHFFDNYSTVSSRSEKRNPNNYRFCYAHKALMAYCGLCGEL